MQKLSTNTYKLNPRTYYKESRNAHWKKSESSTNSTEHTSWLQTEESK